MSEKVSQLPSAASVPDDAVIPIVLAGISQKATALQLRGSGGSPTPSMLFRTPLGELLAVSGDVAIKEGASLGASPSTGARLLVQDSILVQSTITLSGTYGTLDSVSFNLAPDDVLTVAFAAPGGTLYADPGTFARIGNLSPGQLVITNGTVKPVADTPVSVANPAELALLPTTVLRDGALVHVRCCDDYFAFQVATATADGITTVTSSNGTSVFVRKGIPSQKNASTGAWHVDKNLGNDSNIGTLAGATDVNGNGALKSIEELNRRLSPNGAFANLTQNVTATLHDTSTQTYGDPAIFIAGGFTVTLVGTETLGSDITVTVTNTSAPSTRGALVATAGPTFVGSDNKKLVATSGTHAGAISAVDGAAVDATHVFVKEWVDAGGTVVNLTTGDKVAIVTQLTTLGSVAVQCRGLGTDLIIKNCHLDKGGVNYGVQLGTSFNGSTSPIMDGCEIGPSGGGGGSWFGNVHFRNCRSTNPNGSHSHGTLYTTGTFFQANFAFTQDSVHIVRAGCAQNSNAALLFTSNAQERLIANIQMENGAGIDIGPSCYFECAPGTGARPWAVAGTASILFRNGARGVYDTNLPALPGGYTLGLTTVTAAQLPQIIGSTSFTSNNPIHMKALVPVAARSTSLGSTTLLATPPAGAYRIHVSFPITVAGTAFSTLTVSVTSTANGVTRTQTSPPIDISALDTLDHTFLCECDGATNISMFTTLTGSAGSLSYKGEATPERYGAAA